MGSKKRKQKQAKRQKYIKKKQEQNIPLSKSSPYDRKTFRYICMALYVILCMYSFGVFYSLEITPNIIESILEFLLVAIQLVLFLYYLIQYGLVMKVRKIRKEKE